MATDRCPLCDWPFDRVSDVGCQPDNCSYRPDAGSPEWYRILRRREELACEVVDA